jgi:uncharacterized protein YcbK (DUF882 family)
MQVSKNFRLEEFVGPKAFKERGNNSIQLIDFKNIVIAQFIRDWFDAAMTINDWYKQGKFTERGLREIDSTTGARYSQHRFGRAIDFTLQGFTAAEIREEILKNQLAFMAKGLTCIEADTPTWVHVDCRYTGLNDILVVPFK